MLSTGITGERSLTVSEAKLASTIGSGLLPVFATAAMIALMEQTAVESVQPFLEEGFGTVGTRLDVQHTSATPLGMVVRCETELTNIDGRRLTFSVSAYDACGLIGSGVHERCIINNDRFMERAGQKLASGKQPGT